MTREDSQWKRYFTRFSQKYATWQTRSNVHGASEAFRTPIRGNLPLPSCKSVKQSLIIGHITWILRTA